MVGEFLGKKYWAIILGGSSGLGLATAKKLAKHGCNICIVHRSRKSDLPLIEQEFAKIKANGVEVLTYNKDALKEEKRQEIITELKEKLGKEGKVRALVHSIAKGNLKPLVGKEERILAQDDFLQTIHAMGVSLFEWAKAILDAKLYAEDARIISYTSEGNTKAWKGYAAVSAAKTTLEAITRSLAVEFAPHGVRANCIQAGVTDTFSFQQIPGSDQIAEFASKQNPYQRLTLPEDIANATYLLCKDEAAWINGAIIPVDGGSKIV